MFRYGKIAVSLQVLVCIATVSIVSLLCFLATPLISYRTDALVLLMVVSVLAMLFDIVPVMITAVLSALIWDFFFIPPVFTFHIDNTEDGLMFLMYFVVALLNTVLVIQIKRERKKLRKKEEEAMIIQLYNTVLSSLSHELKTPISTIIGSADMLENESVKLTASQRKELVAGIGIAGQRLNRQITNLLQMSRLDSGMLQPNLDWCDLEDLIHQLIASNEIAERVKLKLHDPLPLFKVDQFWLEIILQNLILNAINYSPENTPIKITVTAVSPELEIVVSDRGIGIPEFDLERIFDKFYRVSNTGHSGSGIGLSIVKGYVDAMHGKVFAQNNKYGGADFIVRLSLEASYLNQLEHE